MCLQAHYRSELEFSWEGLQAAFVRLKRMVKAVNEKVITASKNDDPAADVAADREQFEAAVFDDLNTPLALTAFENIVFKRGIGGSWYQRNVLELANVLGFEFANLDRKDLRIRPKAATLTETEIETALTARKEARATKDFAKSDAIRDDLIAKGVEVMDGDPLGWDWKLTI
jgi:cysteinyl-tRNA synthetase